jgi:exopolysaccharide biosynthesis polyprenyl glycosylphosphotransferase
VPPGKPMIVDSTTLEPPPTSPRANGAGHHASSVFRSGGQAGPALFVRLARLSDMVVGLGALIGAFVVTNVGRMPQGFGDFLALRLTVKNLVLLLGFAAVWRVVCWGSGLYRWHLVRRRRDEAGRILLASMAGGAVVLIFAAISVTGAFQVITVVSWVGGTAVAMLLVRRFLHNITDVDADARRNVLILGTGPRAMLLGRELSRAESGDWVVGYLDGKSPLASEELGAQYLGGLEDLERVVLKHEVDEVYVALPMRSHYAEIETALRVCERTGVRAKWLADIFESARGRRRYEVSENFSVISITGEAEPHRLLLKRLFDVIGASLALLILSPILACAALAIKLTSRGPVLYGQDRFGLYRRRFRMYKLRTMVANAELLQTDLEHLNEATGPVFKIKDDPRVTAVGRFLRRTSIDEIPQLVNVLRGEMSLVGPRPLPLRDVGRFTEAALVRRFSVRPGMTGLWQISGRSDLSFERWMELDMQYIDQWSLGLDLKIIGRTIPAVLRATGAT